MGGWIDNMRKDIGKDSTPYDEFIWILNNEPVDKIAKSPEEEEALYQFVDRVTTRLEDLYDDSRNDSGVIEDGFGSAWSKSCPVCKKPTMEVVRPGKIQCGNPECDAS